jgi:hypothetical protein
MSEDMHYRYDPKLGYVACSAAEAWDSEERENSMELGNTYIPPEKRSLTDTGTRYEHFGDLLDYLNDGLVAVNYSISRYTSANDDQRKIRLEAAISLVNIYRDQIANIDGQKWNLNNMLDKCVPERGVLEGIRKARVEALKAEPTPPTPPEDDNLTGV